MPKVFFTRTLPRKSGKCESGTPLSLVLNTWHGTHHYRSDPVELAQHVGGHRGVEAKRQEDDAVARARPVALELEDGRVVTETEPHHVVDLFFVIFQRIAIKQSLRIIFACHEDEQAKQLESLHIVHLIASSTPHGSIHTCFEVYGVLRR